MKPILCIYHGNCADGFTAAWAVRQALGEENVEFYPGVHQNPPPDVTGRDVVMVDFSYKRPVLEDMQKRACSILILDHHKSAAEDLAELEEAPEYWAEWLEQIRKQDRHIAAALFDMDRSGAGIAWDFFHDGPRPEVLNYVEDRDLWRFALPGTRDIHAAIFSYPYDFDVWDNLMSVDPTVLEEEGAAIDRKHNKDVVELINNAQRWMVIGGYSVPVLNAPYFFASDAGHIMAQSAPFAACYWDTPDGRTFSLRSREGGIDVSEIAKQYGGGGHAGAAGFRVEIGWEGDMPVCPKCLEAEQGICAEHATALDASMQPTTEGRHT